MSEKNFYLIHMATLFNALNRNRRNNNLDKIDNSVIASKLGILFALKTNNYVNFKSEYVKLELSQLTALQDILSEHFNANMTAEFRTLAAPQQPLSQKTIASDTSSSSPKENFFNKMKGFFKSRSKVQESHA
jgi:hypothetical protein